MDFPITITGRNVEVTDALRDHATEKLTHACRFLDKVTAAHVTFSVEKYRHITEVVVQARGLTLTASEETGDMYASVDQVMGKVEAQAKRQKEKVKARKRHEDKDFATVPDEEPPESPRVILSDTFASKPLTVDDAVKELQSSQRAFIAFHNARTDQVNVLYRRDDGHFGLIEPH